MTQGKFDEEPAPGQFEYALIKEFGFFGLEQKYFEPLNGWLVEEGEDLHSAPGPFEEGAGPFGVVGTAFITTFLQAILVGEFDIDQKVLCEFIGPISGGCGPGYPTMNGELVVLDGVINGDTDKIVSRAAP